MNRYRIVCAAFAGLLTLLATQPHGALAVPIVDAGPPTPPSNPTYDGVTLRWDASTDPDGSLVRYRVYLSIGIFAQATRQLGTIEQTSMTLLAQDYNYYKFFYVTAIDDLGNESEPSERIEIEPAWTRPLAPTDLAYDGGTLSWTAATDNDIVNYVVHGSPSDNWGDPLRTRLGVVTGTSFDTSNFGPEYYFVTAVDRSGNWGPSVSIRDRVPAGSPTGLYVVGHRLHWDASTDPGFEKFSVYSFWSPNFSGQREHIADVAGNSVYVPADKRYQFLFVRQRDIAGNVSAPAMIEGRDDVAPSPPGYVNLLPQGLVWGTSSARDIDYYSVFGSDEGVRDSDAVLIGTTGDPFIGVSQTPFRYYFVTAVDRAGNESTDRRGVGIDLVPSRPLNLHYQDGSLSWQAPPESDIQRFAVYGATKNAFASAKRLAYTDATSFDVSGFDYLHYFVTTIDRALQESAPADEHVPTFKFSLDVRPNPAFGEASIVFAIPTAGRAVVSIYDVRGALVTTLVDGERGMGEYPTAWDGVSGEGSAASAGIYFARFEFDGQVKTRKFVLIR